MKIITKTWQKSLLTLITGLSLLTNANSVRSQIIPDRTLGHESSKVTPTGVKDLIEGGAIRGNNLFHSFSDFNVNTNQQVYFTNPTVINNILTRVTGNNQSNILGTLGVEGNANLFLINPNGIIFGKDATLDIKGSFLASTANAIKFADNTVFSAKDTSEKPLLTMSVPTGVQWGNTPTDDLTNNANLNIGKDLTLSGRNVNITESVLQTGGNLTLEGTEKIKIEDSINNPVILKSAGDMIIQSNQSVEINALNHPDSNITTNRDITLKSPSRLLSNGNYTVGGYFVTEDLQGNVIDFLIPHNNVIKVNGDVTLSDYTGSSLYILASGKVTLGNVTINNPEDNQSITQDISDGKGGNQTITINSKNDVGILDIRSGIYPNKLPNILEDNPSLPSGITATFNNNSIQGDISSNNITNSGGKVFLTNQYQPNLNFISQTANIKTDNIYTGTENVKDGGAIALISGGNITTMTLYSSSYSRFSNVGNGGNIYLKSTRNITTTNIFSDSSSNSNTGNGGAIALITNNGDINTEFINSQSYSKFGSNGNGGDIKLFTHQGNIITAGLNSSTYSNSGIKSHGGTIALTTATGNITTSDINSYALSLSGKAGNGGNIIINANNQITTDNLSSYSFSFSGMAGNGGAIAISSQEGNIINNIIDSSSISNTNHAGNGGNINIYTAQGNINTDDLKSLSQSSSGNAGNGGTINLLAANNIQAKFINSFAESFFGLTGNGGNISIKSQEGKISTKVINTYSSSNYNQAGNGGNINLIGGGNITTEAINTYSYAQNSQTGNGGNMKITISDGKILIPYINSSAIGEQGTGGAIAIDANKLALDNIVIESNGENGSNGGQIILNSPEIKITNSDISSSSFDSGNSGTIQLISTGNTNLNNSRLLTALEPGSTGMGGDISVETQNLNLQNSALIDTGTYSSGNAGNIYIKAKNINLENHSNIRTWTAEKGHAGNIFLDIIEGGISLTNNSSISTAATKTASGNSGNIKINARLISLFKGSQIQTLTEGIGTSKAGDIAIDISDRIIIGEINPNPAANDPNALPGENVNKVDSDYQNPNNRGTQRIKYSGTNHDISTAQKLTSKDFLINNPQAKNPNVEYSSRIPYTSIYAIGDDKIHVYEIKVNAGTRAVFDIDNTGYDTSGNFGTEEYATYPIVNTKITLLDNQGQILASNDDSSHGFGREGSNKNMTWQQDPYLRYSFNQGGNYYIQISDFEGKGIPSIDRYNRPISYDLQISLEPSPIQANLTNLGQPSGIFAYTKGTEKAGNITINSNSKLQLNMYPDAIISASTSGTGKGGDIKITATDIINISGKGTLKVETTDKGDAGNIEINSQKLHIKEAKISAKTTEKATRTGGNINIKAQDVKLDKDASITAKTVSNNGGNIKLEISRFLILLDPININATAGTAQSGGDGGNIEINSPFIFAFTSNPKHQIIANAYTGKGGNINITSNGIFGSEYIDINTSSQFGVNGTININTPGIDPGTGLVKLPSIPIDVSKLIHNNCKSSQTNSFVITGRNGLPLSPHEVLTPNQILQNFAFSPRNITNKSPIIPENNLSKQSNHQQNTIKESQGWIKDHQGHIILTSQPVEVTASGVYLHPLDCQGLQQLNQ
jgi:filamentous hemagglutinin family protein